jgi:hypothetical protein
LGIPRERINKLEFLTQKAWHKIKEPVEGPDGSATGPEISNWDILKTFVELAETENERILQAYMAASYYENEFRRNANPLVDLLHSLRAKGPLPH